MDEIPIEDISLYPVTTPRVTGEPSQHVLVQCTAEDGTTGWGEMSDFSHLPALMPDVNDLASCLNELLVGRNALDVNRIEDVLLANYPGTRFHGKACLVRSGISIAVHDLKARLLGLSVSELLGGKRRSSIPVCFPIFRMRNREDVENRLELVETKWKEGFRTFRFYFGHNTDADEVLLQRLFDRYGSELRIVSLDGSGKFTLPAFLRIYGRLKQFPFETIESPVHRDDIPAIAEARRSVDHPISEHVRSPGYALRLIRQRAVDIFNVSISVAGGFTGMRRLFSLAEAAGLDCLIGTTQELSVATAAQAHAGAIAPRLDHPSDPVGPVLYTEDVTRDPVKFEQGSLVVPEGDGLGIDVSLEQIQALQEPLSSLNDVITGFPRD